MDYVGSAESEKREKKWIYLVKYFCLLNIRGNVLFPLGKILNDIGSCSLFLFWSIDFVHIWGSNC